MGKSNNLDERIYFQDEGYSRDCQEARYKLQGKIREWSRLVRERARREHEEMKNWVVYQIGT